MSCHWNIFELVELFFNYNPDLETKSNNNVNKN